MVAVQRLGIAHFLIDTETEAYPWRDRTNQIGACTDMLRKAFTAFRRYFNNRLLADLTHRAISFAELYVKTRPTRPDHRKRIQREAYRIHGPLLHVKRDSTNSCDHIAVEACNLVGTVINELEPKDIADTMSLDMDWFLTHGGTIASLACEHVAEIIMRWRFADAGGDPARHHKLKAAFEAAWMADEPAAAYQLVETEMKHRMADVVKQIKG
jgi:hypothetical protein